MKHYFITNREVNEDGIIRPDGRERAQDVLRFGEYNVNDSSNRIEKFKVYEDRVANETGSFGDYSDEDFDNVGSGKFFKNLYDDMSSEDGGDVLVFVHGFETDLDGAGQNVEDLHEKYVLNDECPVKHIVIFTWPGKDLLVPLHYRNDFKDAERSGDELYRVLKMFNKFNDTFFLRRDNQGNRLSPCEKKIHLMCHSMGHVVLRSMAKAAKAQEQGLVSIFHELLLMAANIEWDDLQFGKDLEEIGDLGDRIHIYHNYSDFALDIARYTKRRFRKQLGKYGVKDISNTSKNIYQVDVTSLRKEEPGFIDHWYYYKSPSVISDVTNVLFGEGIDQMNRRKVDDRSFKLLKN